MHVGPEPSPEVFQVVMAGTATRTVKGSALCILDELPYAGLGKFGAQFLGKFQVRLFFSTHVPRWNCIHCFLLAKLLGISIGSFSVRSEKS